MSDLISRELLTKEIVNRPTEQSGYNPVYLNGCATRQNEIIDIINDMPTVEAVPVQALTDAILDKTKVVRCKDCKHSDLPAVLTRKYGKDGTLTCHNRYGSCNNRNVNENDFCSAGELPEQI